MPEPKRKPRKAPNADFREPAASFWLKTSSARKEHISEVAIMPTGKGMNIPRKRPTMAPRLAYLLPPVVFVNHAGTI